MENLGFVEQVPRGIYQQILEVLNTMDRDSRKSGMALLDLARHKAQELVIIGKKANREPSMVISILTHCLQMPETSPWRKVNIFKILCTLLPLEGKLEEQCAQRLVIIASEEMREASEMEADLKADAASDTLVALSRDHFSLVMCDIQQHLKPFQLSHQFVIITLAKLANDNVFQFMTYMGISLATIFRMLRIANEAKMRQVIWGAVETFCEKVQFYLRNVEEGVSPVMSEEQFANKLFPFYRYFVTTWLKEEHVKVKLQVIKCLKPMMSFLLPHDDLREQVYDYIPLVLAENQSSVEALFITQVLRQILEVVVNTNTPVPRRQLHMIFVVLHTQICSQVSSQEQSTSQHQTEILPCFIALARSYPEELMNFFLCQMERSEEAILVGTLTLIEAIVGADEPRMSMRTICLATTVVKSILSDPKPKVRMAVLKIIGQLALSGYQDQVKGWGLKYVSVQLTLSTCKLTHCQDSLHVKDMEEEEMVHGVSMDTVKTVTSSVSGRVNEIWVSLVCYILEADFSEALMLICSDLLDLAEHQLEDKDLGAGTIIPRRHADLPAPPKLLARLLVLMSSPNKYEGRGIILLRLVWILSQSIAPSMAAVWELEIPILMKYLAEHNEFTWSKKTWEEKLIQGFLYRALGVSLATGLDAEKVEVLLLDLLMKTDYDNAFEREGAVLSCCLCARGQVLTVLNALGDFEEKIQETVQSLQLGIWQKDQPQYPEQLKTVLMDMYGSVVSSCHPLQLVHLFRTRLGNLITTKIVQHYSSSCQDISLKMAFMKAILEIARALKIVERLEDFEFVQKTTVTSLIMEILKAESAKCLASPVWTRALDVLLHLSKLKPLYVGAENKEVMDFVFHSVISLVPPDEDNDSTKMLCTDAMRALEELMENLMQWQLDPKMLQEMVQLLEKWILSPKYWEREKALNVFLALMQTYMRSVGICIPLKLGQFGSLAGVIAPCTCDPHQRIQVASIDILSSLLDLYGTERPMEQLPESGREEVVCTEFSIDEVVSLIQKLCDNIGTLGLQHDKASVIWIGTFLEMRVKELEDKVAEIMATILAHMRRVDHPEVRCPLIQDILLLALHHQDTVLSLLLRQPLPMERHLTEVWLAVAEELPLARIMLRGLMERLQSQFWACVNATPKADICRLATVDPMMILCPINLLLDSVDQDHSLPDILPELAYTLLLQLGSSHWPEATSPILKSWHLVYSGAPPQNIKLQRLTINCLQLLFKKGKAEGLMNDLEEQGAWGILENHTCFPEGITLFTRLFLRNMGEHRHELSHWVLKGMDSGILSCRILSTAMCVEVRPPAGRVLGAQVPQKCCPHMSILDEFPGIPGKLMQSPVLHQEKLLKAAVVLLERAVDQEEEEVLRVLSLRALGNMAHGAPKKVRKYQKLLVGRFLSCLQEPNNISVICEGMASLTKVLPELRQWTLGSTFDTICRQCRTFFDSENKELRQKAFVLFGKLASTVCITKKPLFKKEMKKAWVPLMLHCLDPCTCTAKACMETMWQCMRVWGCKDLESPQGQSTTTMKEITLFQTAVCALLSEKKPAALKKFLVETIQYIQNSSSSTKVASCKLAVFQELQLDEEIGVKTAAREVLNILDNCSRSQHGHLVSPGGAF
ncbi:maestro heat-like repeat-containing protein family member 2A [Rhynchocyon petersi]